MLFADAPWRDQPTGRIERALRLAFFVFAGAIAFSLAGSLLLKLVPSTMRLFAPAYPWLVKTPTWTYMALMPVISLLMYARGLGRAGLAFFALWGCLIGGLSELVGTTTGVPFGTYMYTEWLGAKIMDHVPYFIPPSWFAMSIVSHDLASRVTSRVWERIAVSAVFMTLWDFALDPAMNRAFPFWVYPEGGFFYGMPASNWLGWLGVSAVIAFGYEVIGGGLPRLSRWAPWVYALNCLFPLGLSLIYGLHLAVVVGLVAMALPLLAVHRRGARRGWDDRKAEDWRSASTER